MTPEEVVQAVKVVAFDSAVDGTVKHLESGPDGRGLQPRSVALSDWYNGLAAEDRLMVIESVRDAAHAAVFGVMCVLDGVRVVDKAPDVGLRLTATDQLGVSTKLTDSDSCELHDEFNALGHPPSEPWPPRQEGV